MQVVLEGQTLPENGLVALNGQRTFEIKVTAEEARRRVNRWLMWEVDMLLENTSHALVVIGIDTEQIYVNDPA